MYQVVLDFVNKNILPLQGIKVVRPFWPGGDYQSVEYPENSVVIDNPPFSILSEIRNFYQERGIRYFLFAPSLTCLSSTVSGGDTVIVCDSPITYENGAVVNTAFVTNMLPDLAIWVNGDLGKALTEASRLPCKLKPRYVYDPHVITTAILGKYARPGIDWKIRRADCAYVRSLDCQGSKSIFGNGYLISERAAVERAAVERAAIQEPFRWELSEREWAIIRSLGR